MIEQAQCLWKPGELSRCFLVHAPIHRRKFGTPGLTCNVDLDRGEREIYLMSDETRDNRRSGGMTMEIGYVDGQGKESILERRAAGAEAASLPNPAALPRRARQLGHIGLGPPCS